MDLVTKSRDATSKEKFEMICNLNEDADMNPLSFINLRSIPEKESLELFELYIKSDEKSKLKFLSSLFYLEASPKKANANTLWIISKVFWGSSIKNLSDKISEYCSDMSSWLLSYCFSWIIDGLPDNCNFDRVSDFSSDYLYIKWSGLLKRDSTQIKSLNSFKNIEEFILNLDYISLRSLWLTFDWSFVKDSSSESLKRFWADLLMMAPDLANLANDEVEKEKDMYIALKSMFYAHYNEFLNNECDFVPFEELFENPLYNPYFKDSEKMWEIFSSSIIQWGINGIFWHFWWNEKVPFISDLPLIESCYSYLYLATCNLKDWDKFLKGSRKMNNPRAYISSFFSCAEDPQMADLITSLAQYDWSEWIFEVYLTMLKEFETEMNSNDNILAHAALEAWKKIMLDAAKAFNENWNIKTEEYIEKMKHQASLIKYILKTPEEELSVERLNQIPGVKFDIVNGQDLIISTDLIELYDEENFINPEILSNRDFSNLLWWIKETWEKVDDPDLIKEIMEVTANWFCDGNTKILTFRLNWEFKWTYRLKETEDWLRHWGLYLHPDLRQNFSLWTVFKNLLQWTIEDKDAILFWEAILDNFDWIYSHVEKWGWIWTKVTSHSKTAFLYLWMSNNTSQEYFSKYDTKDMELKREDFEQMTWVEIINVSDVDYLDFCLEKWGVVTRVLKNPDSFVVEFNEERDALSRLDFELEKPLEVDDDFGEKIVA